MSMLAGEVHGFDLPQTEKRLLTIVEMDGCFSDGVAVATNCWVGHRTMRVQDYGKIAATYVDTWTGYSVRIWPSLDSRILAPDYAPEATSRWEAYLLGYQRIPIMQLFSIQEVKLSLSVEQILSKPDHKVVCDSCGEEIFNERELTATGRILCQACAGNSYYSLVPKPIESTVGTS
jgi:formylmethanofuran dehydrogenase subunit E